MGQLLNPYYKLIGDMSDDLARKAQALRNKKERTEEEERYLDRYEKVIRLSLEILKATEDILF